MPRRYFGLLLLLVLSSSTSAFAIPQCTKSITVDKITSPNPQSAFDFDFAVMRGDNVIDNFDLSSIDDPHVTWLDTGIYSVSEAPDTIYGWQLLAGYPDTYCYDVAHPDVTFDPARIDLRVADHVRCQFTNHSEPTAVTVSYFLAEAQDWGVLVTWETTMEVDTRGFNLYRATASWGPYTKLNSQIIAAQAVGSSVGALYTFTDLNPAPSHVYYYFLAEVNGAGEEVDLLDTSVVYKPSVTRWIPLY